jgi:hypothetical protein
MDSYYEAYGLTLHASFELLGMVPRRTASLPPLALELLDRSQLASIWSGADGPPAWRGVLGDGSSLTIEAGRAGDLLITDGERASFHLDRCGEALGCAPSDGGAVWQRTLLSKVLSIVSILRGHEALHASAVQGSSGVIAILAPVGSGKTTIALELLGRAYRLVSDDVLTLAQSPDGVLALAGTPHMNVALGGRGLSALVGARTLALAGEEQWVAVASSADQASPLDTIVMLQRDSGRTLDLEVLPPSPLPFAPYMLGLLDDADRARRRFQLYADLAASATLLRVSAGPDDTPAEIVDLILEGCAGQQLRHAVGATG